MGGAVDAVNEEALYVLVIAGVLVVQAATHSLEHRVHGFKQVSETLAMMYRELTVLGIVAFGLSTLETSGAIHVEVADKHVFEKVHNSLFVVAVIYGLIVGATLYIGRRVSKMWYQWEELSFGKWKELKAEWDVLKAKMGLYEDDEPPPFWRALTDKTARRWKELVNIVTYHDLRYYTIQRHNLKASKEAFSLAIYFDICKAHVFQELVEISSSSWVVFAVALAVDLLVRGLVSSYAGVVDITVHTIVTMLLLLFMTWKTMMKSMYAYVVVRMRERMSITVEEAQDCEEDGYCSAVPALETAGIPQVSAPVSFELDMESDKFKVPDRTKTDAAAAPTTRPRKRRMSTVTESAQAAARRALRAKEDPMKLIESMYWLNNPELVLRLLQVALFGYCLNLALVITYWSSVSHNPLLPVLIAVIVVTGGLIMRWISATIPAWIATVYAGDGTDHRMLSRAVMKAERRAAERRADDDSPSDTKSRLIGFSKSGHVVLRRAKLGWSATGSTEAGIRATQRLRRITTLATLLAFFAHALTAHERFRVNNGATLWWVAAACSAILVLGILLEVVTFGLVNFFKFSVFNTVDLAVTLTSAAFVFFVGGDPTEDPGTATVVVRGLILLRLVWPALVLPAIVEKEDRGGAEEGDGDEGGHGSAPSVAADFQTGLLGDDNGSSAADMSTTVEESKAAPGDDARLRAAVEAAAAGSQVELDDSTFEKVVLSSDEPWIIKVYASWCGNCKRFKPTWDAAFFELGGMCKWANIDCDANPMMRRKLEIDKYPMVLMFPGGKKDLHARALFSRARTQPNLAKFIEKFRHQDIKSLLNRSTKISEQAEAINKANTGKKLVFEPGYTLTVAVAIPDADPAMERSPDDVFAGRKVVVFGLPAPFTPTCTDLHVPGFQMAADQIKKHGVDEVLCMTRRDAFTAYNWGLSLRTGDTITFLGDRDGVVTDMLGVGHKHKLLGEICFRFAMIVDHGIVTWFSCNPPVDGDVDALSESNHFSVLHALEAGDGKYIGAEVGDGGGMWHGSGPSSGAGGGVAAASAAAAAAAIDANDDHGSGQGAGARKTGKRKGGARKPAAAAAAGAKVDHV